VVSSWVTVIVTAPACTIVTVLPDTVATLKFELVYEKAPILLEDGSVIVKVAPLEKV
jgi:hypothetical protein